MFAYFIPTKASSITREIEQLLPYAWKKNDCYGPQVMHGPLGGGLIVARKSIPLNLLQFGNAEEWRKIPGKEAYVKQVAEPTHEGLARAEDEFLDGFSVELADGKRWVIPRALAWHDINVATITLPRLDKLQDDGTWGLGEVLPQYRKLRDVTNSILTEEWTYETEVNSVVTAMSVHYYVDAIECDMMGILSKQHRVPVWNAIMDTEGYIQLKKKAEDAGLTSEHGS